MTMKLGSPAHAEKFIKAALTGDSRLYFTRILIDKSVSALRVTTVQDGMPVDLTDCFALVLGKHAEPQGFHFNKYTSNAEYDLCSEIELKAEELTGNKYLGTYY